MEIFEPLDLAFQAKPAGNLGSVLIGVAAYLGKSFMLYQPMKEVVNDFKPYGMDGISVIARTSDTLTLCGFIFSPKECADKTKIPTVLYFQENAGTLGHRFSYFSSYVNKCQVNLVVFGYRGYSKSPGHPSMAGLKKDADAILEKLFKDYAPQYGFDQLILHGKSLGGGVASYVSSHEKWKLKVKKIILDSTFNSVSALISDIIPSLKQDSVDKDIFTNENWEVIENTPHFNESAPVLVIGVKDDEICAVRHSIRLKEKLESLQRQVKYVEFQEGGHNGFVDSNEEKYFEEIKSFVHN